MKRSRSNQHEEKNEDHKRVKLSTDPLPLPTTIDDVKQAVHAFRSQRSLLLSLIRHCLPSLANSLLSSYIIPEEIHEKACNENRGTSERGVALLDCVEARIKATPNDFIKVLQILQAEPFLKELVNGLVQSYSGNLSDHDSMTTCSPTISRYGKYLKSLYKNSPISPESKWPPTPSRKYINLAVVEGGACRDDYIGHTLHGKVDQVLRNRKEISLKEILEPDGDQDCLRLVFIEGAPGIGKSTLAWELCRKWEEFSCMKQYSLVVLLRLREEEVQSITKLSDLFPFCEEEKTLATEVLENHGSRILFVMDGFDELPKAFQTKGFLLDLIRGRVLPASTVVVTSRPSATAQLFTRCRPQIQKHIEILGFTQESVEAYASSVFADPDKAEKFKAYISASDNPAINSLMYIPLNAAVIVEIYSHCKSDRFLPHTLTELYTQLCLTFLNRHLHNKDLDMVEKIEDLPSHLFEQFLSLSKVALERVKNQEIIFHTVPPNLVHFGFLDAVSALYGGGRVSYNFLHLTLQEFLAAYFISHQREDGLELFKQHGKDSQWNVVWRFVAGLTKFQYYKDHIDCDELFIYNDRVKVDFNNFFLQCLYEAQTVKNFNFKYPSGFGAWLSSQTGTPLDMYALGYCISNVPTGLCWHVYLQIPEDYEMFLSGLKTRVPQANTLGELIVYNHRSLHYTVSLSGLKLCSLDGLTFLTIQGFPLTTVDMLFLSELVPCLPSLVELDISDSKPDEGLQDGLLQVLQSISHSSVTTLQIWKTGFTSLLHNSPHEYSTALKTLIDPSSGRLRKLGVGGHQDQRLLDLVSAPSSLSHLSLHEWNFSLAGLENNTNLLELEIRVGLNVEVESQDMVKLLAHNKTLRHLIIRRFPHSDTVFAKAFVDAVCGNNTLHTVTLLPEDYSAEYARDSRIELKSFLILSQ